jgi:hypothetical protein
VSNPAARPGSFRPKDHGIAQGQNTASSPVSPVQTYGRYSDAPSPVVFTAPARLCDPIDGQPYGIVPTARHGVPMAWAVEVGDDDVARVVHRGDCRPERGAVLGATAAQARAALERGAEPCDVCRPDRALRSG